jgi:hypothetical protein
MLKFSTLAFVLIALSCTTPASAYTQQEQQACMNDAFTFCGYAIPDEGRVKACLIANVPRLSPACKILFRAPPGPPGRRRYRVARPS